MDMELWMPIKGFDGKYSVSNLGRVRSEARQYSTGQHNITIDQPTIIMRQKKKANGYFAVCLSYNGKPIYKYVHRLVAEAFIENPMNLPIINHKDRNPSNNAAENLEWCTPKYNATYDGANIRSARGRMKKIVQKTLGGEIIKVWESTEAAAKAFNNKHAKNNINNVLKNDRRKTAYGYKWEYFDVRSEFPIAICIGKKEN